MLLHCIISENKKSHNITLNYINSFGNTITRRTLPYYDNELTLNDILKQLCYLEISLNNSGLTDMLLATQELHKEITRLKTAYNCITWEQVNTSY